MKLGTMKKKKKKQPIINNVPHLNSLHGSF